MPAVVCKASEGLTGWYTIVKVEHEGISELRPTSYGAALYLSERISDACVEGSREEMLTLAEAIEKREYESHKRCAVDARTDRVELWSPRNSQRPGIVSRAEADALAAQIRRDLGAPTDEKAEER